MRIWFTILGAGVLLAAGGMLVSATNAQTGPATLKTATPASPAARAGSLYDFTLTGIDGRPMPLSAYRGKVVLLVNTASFCGFTPQYEGLQKLQTSLGPKGFTVVGVPSGDFMNQEYEDNRKIREFCDVKFGINFPLAERSVVKGPDAIPLYRWAKTQIPTENEPKWNFHKFLIGRDGHVIAGFNSKITPESPELMDAISKAMKS